MGKLLSFLEGPDNGVLFVVLYLVGTAVALGVGTLIADKWFKREKPSQVERDGPHG